MKIYFITACFNEARAIGEHIKYLNKLCKKYRFKYIIADGGSNDGTINVIQNVISADGYYIENSGGIYQSWNAAINSIRENNCHIVFLGVSDFILEEYIDEIKSLEFYDIFLTGLSIGGKKYRLKSKKDFISTLSSVFSCMPVHHSGTVFSRRLFQEVGLFSINYSISSDLDWMLRLKKVRILHIHGSKKYGIFMKPNGVSSGVNKTFKLLKEELSIAFKHHLFPCPKRLSYLFIYALYNKIKRIFVYL